MARESNSFLIWVISPSRHNVPGYNRAVAPCGVLHMHHPNWDFKFKAAAMHVMMPLRVSKANGHAYNDVTHGLIRISRQNG